MTLKKIRFYKQKFVIEWEIDEIEMMDSTFIDLDDCCDEEEDLPSPREDDIVSLRQHYLKQVEERIRKLNDEKQALESHIHIFEDLVEKVQRTNNFSEVSCICSDLDKLLE
jgi:hypothetical protein